MCEHTCEPVCEMGGEWAPVGDPVIGADPGHRIKGFGKEAYALANAVGSRFNNDHAKYLKRSYGYILKKYAHEDDATAQYVQQRLRIGIMQHGFGDHRDCESDWCKYKLAEERGEPAPKPPAGHLLPVDKKSLLEKGFEKFSAPEMLAESLHPFMSQANEALNQRLSAKAPKNRFYSGTHSLNYRASSAVGEHNLGHLNFHARVLKAVGVEDLGVHARRALGAHDRNAAKKRKYESSLARKSKRAHKEHTTQRELLLRRQLAGAAPARGNYASGSATDDVLAAAAHGRGRGRGRGRGGGAVSASAGRAVACRCGSLTHQRTNSLDCPLNSRNRPPAPAAAPVAAAAPSAASEAANPEP